MNIVKWIHEDEVEISIDDEDTLQSIKASGRRVYKRLRNGSRRSKEFYSIRYESIDRFSPVTYEFTDNHELLDLCLFLHSIGFVFWGTFKTEKSPFDYMCYLQRKHIIKESFLYLDAGDDIAKTHEYKIA
jgi:hypothetical protein